MKRYLIALVAAAVLLGACGETTEPSEIAELVFTVTSTDALATSACYELSTGERREGSEADGCFTRLTITGTLRNETEYLLNVQSARVEQATGLTQPFGEREEVVWRTEGLDAPCRGTLRPMESLDCSHNLRLFSWVTTSTLVNPCLSGRVPCWVPVSGHMSDFAGESITLDFHDDLYGVRHIIDVPLD